MIRLAVDTAFEQLAMALTEDGVTLADFLTKSRRRNAAILFEVLDNLLSKAAVKLSEIDAFVINQGPGSYTGVRIGMALVKTLAQVGKKPIVPVNSLQLLAAQISRETQPFPVLLNCTGQDLFQAEFQIRNGHVMQLTPIHLSQLQQMHKIYSKSQVILHRIPDVPTGPDSLFNSFQSLSKDRPVADAVLLDRVGGKIMSSDAFDPGKPVHPLYIKRDV